MESFSRSVLTFLLNSLWQIPVVTAVAILICWFMRNGPAAHRHVVWVAALFASILLPLASVSKVERSESSRFAISNTWLNSAPPAAIPKALATARTAPDRLNRTVPLAQQTASLVLALYAVFLLVRLSRLARTSLHTLQIRRSAAEIPVVPALIKAVLVRCREAFRLGHVELLCSPRVSSPVTTGNTVILPDCLLSETSEDMLTSAIGHEAAHIARHDFALSLIYEFLYLPISFHPAAWVIRRGIGHTREMSCDELVTRQLLDAGVYARSIVSIASTMKGLTRPGFTLGVFDGDNLEERIRRLLSSPVTNLKRARFLLAGGLTALGLCAVAVSSLALTARAQGSSYGEMRLAETAYNAGDFKTAVEHFENAAKLDVTNTKPKLFLANALLRESSAHAGQPDPSLAAQAREQYLDVVAHEPRNRVAMLGIIKIAVEGKHTSEARDWAMKLIQADPADKVGYYTVGVMDWASAFPEFQKAKQAAGIRIEEYIIPDANLRRSLREQYLPQVEDGLHMLEMALQIDPGYDDAMAYTNLLYRLKAGLVDSPTEAAGMIAQADEWVHKALDTRKQNSATRTSETAQLNIDGPAPVPENTPRLKAPPPPPPPGGAGNQIASAAPAPRPRNAEQPAPYWQVLGATDAPAIALFRRLESKGFRGMLIRANEDGQVRVMAGPYFDQQSLEKAKGEIEAAGFRPLRVW